MHAYTLDTIKLTIQRTLWLLLLCSLTHLPILRNVTCFTDTFYTIPILINPTYLHLFTLPTNTLISNPTHTIFGDGTIELPRAATEDNRLGTESIIITDITSPTNTTVPIEPFSTLTLYATAIRHTIVMQLALAC